MTAEQTAPDILASARRLASTASDAVDAAIAATSRLTDGGKLIDEHQVQAERIAQHATWARAADELVAYCERLVQAGRQDALAESQALAFAAETVHRLRGDAEANPK